MAKDLTIKVDIKDHLVVLKVPEKYMKQSWVDALQESARESEIKNLVFVSRRQREGQAIACRKG